MNSINFIGPLLFIAGVAVFVLVVVAIAQDLRQERKYGYRQAFYTIVALVMLVLTVGAGISLLGLGLRETVLTSAKEYSQRYNGPPPFYLPSTQEKAGSATAYTCTTDCQFTTADKESFTTWKESYATWQKDSNGSLNTRRELAGGLSLLIVALPLYLLFMRWMNRGAKEETQNHQKPSPLRSVYFYGVSFAGLVLAVVGGAMLLNSVIGTWLKTTPMNENVTRPTGIFLSNETAGVDSVVACQSACGFTSDDVTLAQAWKTDWATYQDRQKSNNGATANDLATTIPLIVFGVPLFWFHFARIRKETQTTPSTPTAA